MVTASDGDEGLIRARQFPPDLITLDVIMPGLDGWALLAALKAEPTLADVPVIMLTIADDRNKGFALGASEYLTKPLDRVRLAALLQKYCVRERRRSALFVEDDEVNTRVLREALEKEGGTWPRLRTGRGPRRGRGTSPRPDLEAGCDEYHTKPVQFPRLMAQIQALLEKGGSAIGRRVRTPA